MCAVFIISVFLQYISASLLYAIYSVASIGTRKFFKMYNTHAARRNGNICRSNIGLPALTKFNFSVYQAVRPLSAYCCLPRKRQVNVFQYQSLVAKKCRPWKLEWRAAFNQWLSQRPIGTAFFHITGIISHLLKVYSIKKNTKSANHFFLPFIIISSSISVVFFSSLPGLRVLGKKNFLENNQRKARRCVAQSESVQYNGITQGCYLILSYIKSPAHTIVFSKCHWSINRRNSLATRREIEFSL